MTDAPYRPPQADPPPPGPPRWRFWGVAAGTWATFLVGGILLRGALPTAFDVGVGALIGFVCAAADSARDG